MEGVPKMFKKCLKPGYFLQCGRLLSIAFRNLFLQTTPIFATVLESLLPWSFFVAKRALNNTNCSFILLEKLAKIVVVFRKSECMR